MAPARTFSHSRAGHRSVIGSTTVSSWLRSKSVNRLRGWSRVVGSEPGCGCSPVSCAGTASVVRSSTVVALRYQVDSRASRAKFGNSPASILPPASASVLCGSSSSTTCTIGVCERAGPATAPPASLGNSRPRTGDTTRNRSSTISGAGESTVTKDRTPAARAYRTDSARAHEQRDRDRERRAAEQVAGGRQHQPRDDQPDEHEHRRPPELRPDPPERPHDAGADQRRHEHVAERQQQDVPGRAAARDEELRVAPEQVEQRLRERERPQAAEVQRRPPEADRAAHANGRAS